MEFKGTRGKWQVSSDELSNTIEVYKSGKGDICEINTDDDFLIESIWNAKLISKAPEMLEMLKRQNELIKFLKGTHYCQYSEAKELIKSATEL